MKRVLLLSALVIGVMACGGNAEKQKDQDIAAQEAEAVDEISSDIDASQRELQNETDESLNEIDSLLQNVE